MQLNHAHQSHSVTEYVRRALVASLATRRVPTMWQLGPRDKSPSSARLHLSKRRTTNYTHSLLISVPDHLIEVLRFAQDGDLSLQQRLQRKLPDPRMIRPEAHSLQDNGFRVPARPWTAVAGDGIVSDLVSRFFDIDQPFYCAMVDHSALVSDMRASDTAVARYCSPILVNAICALGAVSSAFRPTSAQRV
jgi:hypothetical protein